MEASRWVKREAVAIVIAIVVIIAGAFLVKNYFYAEKPLPLSPPEEQQPVGQKYIQQTAENRIAIVEKQTGTPVAEVKFEGLETGIKEIDAKTVAPNNPAFRSEIFAVKEGAQFSKAAITLKKTGKVDAIYYCQKFDFENENCTGGWEKTGILFTETDNSVTFTVEHFSAYVAGVNTTLSIYSFSRPASVQAPFFADFRNSSNNAEINSTFANLTINFSDGISANMTFNATANLWQYNRSFTSEGTYNYTVHAVSGLENLTANDNITIFNCTVPVDNFYVNNNITLCSGNYFIDDTGFDGVLIANASNINVDCNGAGISGNAGGIFIGVSSKDNVNFSNCNAGNYRFGIFTNGATNLSFTNSTLSATNFYLQSGRNLVLRNVTFSQALIILSGDLLIITSFDNILLQDSSFATSAAMSGYVLNLQAVSNISFYNSNFTDTASSDGFDGFRFLNVTNALINSSRVRAHTGALGGNSPMQDISSLRILNSFIYAKIIIDGYFTDSEIRDSNFSSQYITILINSAGNNITIANSSMYLGFGYPSPSLFNLSNSTIENNSISGTFNLKLQNTNFRGNNISGGKSQLIDSNNNSIANNVIHDISGSSGFVLVNGTNNYIYNLTIYNVSSPSTFDGGFLFYSGANNTISNILAYNNSIGINFNTGDNVIIENSTFINSSVYDFSAYPHIVYPFYTYPVFSMINVTLGTKIYLPAPSGLGGAVINATNLSFTNASSSVSCDNLFTYNLTLSDTITLGDNLISIDPSSYPQLSGNCTNLIFRNLDWTATPQLFKNGVRCDDNASLCNITSYDFDTGILTARVSSFSNYTTGNASTCLNVTDDLYINRDATICPGTYYVNDTNDDGIIIINATGSISDTLVLDMSAGVDIEGNGSGVAVAAENKSNILIKSGWMTINNFSTAFYLNNVSNSLVSGGAETLSNNMAGFLLNNSLNNTLLGIYKINNNINGVVIHGGGNNSVLNVSSISNNTIGINITSSQGNRIEGGVYYSWIKMHSNQEAGILLTDSQNTLFNLLDLFSDNVGLSLQNSSNTTIEDSSFTSNNKGIFSNSSSSVSITSSFACNYDFCKFFSKNNVSVELVDSSAVLSTVNATNNSVGINLINSTANISGSIFKNNSVALIVNKTANANILSNNFTSNSINIYLADSTGVNISGLSITGSAGYDLLSIDSNATIASLVAENPIFSDSSSNTNITSLNLSAENSTIRYDSLLINDTVNTTTGLYLLFNLSGIDTSVSPGLNKSATITLFNLLWPTTPFVEKDGVRCDNTSDCTIISYNNTTGDLIFNVTGFSNYSSSNPNLPGTPDTTPPTQPTVYDGLNFVDYTWTSSNTTLKGSWNGSFDRSNIFYSYRIKDTNGSCIGGCALKYVGSAQQVTVSNLSLPACHDYFFEVQAEDTFYNLANISSSDGITVDLEDPAILSVDSPTHPSQGVFYPLNRVELNWTAVDINSSGCAGGVAGYSYLFDQDSGTFPDDVIDTNETNITFANVPNGVWYFHIKAMDYAGNPGAAAVRTVMINATQVTVTLDPSETPTLAKNATIFGKITANSSDKIIIYKNNVNTANRSISQAQTFFNFTLNLDMGINAIYVNATLNNSIVAKSNTLYIRRVNETRVNISGFTVSYSGGSLTDYSASSLLSTGSTEADFGIGKSSGRLFVFVTTTDADTFKRGQYAANDTLFDQTNPSIGFPFEIEQNVISTILNYQDLSIVGNQSVQTGRYTLIITNNGTVNGTPQIIVKLT